MHSGSFTLEANYGNNQISEEVGLAAGFDDGESYQSLSFNHTQFNNDLLPGRIPSETEISYSHESDGRNLTLGVVGNDGNLTAVVVNFGWFF